MENIPNNIKKNGYIATRNDDHYIVEYISGGHIPHEATAELTIEEMEIIYNDYSKWNDVIIQAKRRKQEEG